MSIAAWVVQADLGSENSMLRGNRASFFSTLPYIATTKNWVLFFLQYRGNDLLIFQDDEAKKKKKQREKTLLLSSRRFAVIRHIRHDGSQMFTAYLCFTSIHCAL